MAKLTRPKSYIGTNLDNKRENEKRIVGLMIDIYCKGNGHSNNGICSECTALKDYANLRVDKCPFMEAKTFCSSCRVHCYKEDMRDMIREVMRYSGPRMLLHHPIITIRHMIEEYMEKKGRSEGLAGDQQKVNQLTKFKEAYRINCIVE